LTGTDFGMFTSILMLTNASKSGELHFGLNLMPFSGGYFCATVQLFVSSAGFITINLKLLS
jgi:hypothetical protein